MTTYSSEDSDPTVDNFETWYKDPSVEDEVLEDNDFRFLKVHPVLVDILGFICFLPMRIITFGVILFAHFC